MEIVMEHVCKNKCKALSIEIMHTKFCTDKFQTIKLHGTRFNYFNFVE